ncbi:MAG: minor capsid protein [Nitrospirae bacterium]|nr:minor capsid protein [Nitrospirota bacterium]
MSNYNQGNKGVNLSFAIGLPPEKAIEYFKAKGYKITWDWREAMREAHTRDFTVAKAVQLDVLKDIRVMVKKAIDEGITLKQFQSELEPKLRAKGWWGKQEIGTEDGIKTVQLGSPRRLETIYRTNLQVAYMVGRYKGMMLDVANRPYWQYTAVMDRKTRPGHSALNGKIFRYDDSFWNTHYPPNGFRCRCRVRALSSKDMREKGLKAEPVDSPYRHMQPDEGWDYNPGKELPLTDKNGGLPDCPDSLNFAEGSAPPGAKGGCIKVVPGQKTWKDFNRPDLRAVADEMRIQAPDLLPTGKTKEEALSILSSALGLSDAVTAKTIKTPVEEVLIKSELLSHMVEKIEGKRERYGNFITPTLTDPYEIYLTEYEDGFRRRYVGLFTGKENILIVVRINTDGSLVWNYMQAKNKDMNKLRIGELLFGK